MKSTIAQYLVFLAILLPALFSGCAKNPFDTSSSIGKSVLTNEVSVPLDAADAFKVFDDSLPVLAEESFIDPRDSLNAGLHDRENIIVCGSFLGNNAVGRVTFDSTALASFFMNHRDSIQQFRLSIAFSDTLRSQVSIRVFTAKPLLAGAAFTSPLADTSFIGEAASTFGITSLQIPLTMDTAGFKNFILNQRTLIISLVSNTDTIIHIHGLPSDTTSPKLLIMRGTPDTLTSVSQGCASTAYIVTEQNSRDTIPVSSWESGRITRMQLDWGKLWDSAAAPGGRLFHGIVEATLDIPVDSVAGEQDTVTGEGGYLTGDSVMYALSHTKFTEDDSVFALFAFNKARARPFVGDSSKVMHIPLEYYVQNLLANGKPDTCYLYLGLYSTYHQWIFARWPGGANLKAHLHALFANPR